MGSVWTPSGRASSPPSGTCKLLSRPAACHPISLQQGVWQILQVHPGFSSDEAKLGTGINGRSVRSAWKKNQVHKCHRGHLGNLGADPGEELYAAHSDPEISTRWKNQAVTKPCTAEEKEPGVPFRSTLVLQWFNPDPGLKREMA